MIAIVVIVLFVVGCPIAAVLVAFSARLRHLLCSDFVPLGGAILFLSWAGLGVVATAGFARLLSYVGLDGEAGEEGIGALLGLLLSIAFVAVISKAMTLQEENEEIKREREVERRLGELRRIPAQAREAKVAEYESIGQRISERMRNPYGSNHWARYIPADAWNELQIISATLFRLRDSS